MAPGAGARRAGLAGALEGRYAGLARALVAPAGSNVVLEEGQVFAGRYRTVRRLAEGGMGAIFEAEHIGTERRVALKLLFPHVMSVASAREKFELEAKVAARVDSRHIVQVLDAGFDETTQSPYLVMELLRGSTLASLVKSRGALPSREVVLLLRQVAAGLDAAHGYTDARGTRMPIVHRDLKPENLFVTSELDGSPLVKILDFGIAKVLSDTRNVSQEVRGTPLYMAFEQVTAGPLSPATDIWALGLIAYHLLTGERYWRSARAEGASVQSLFAEIITLPMEPPSVRSRQQGLSIDLGPAFDAWLLRCLERDPQRRFPRAGEAIAALDRALASAPHKAETLPLVEALPATRTATFHPRAAFPRAALTSATAAGTAPSLSALASERSGAHGARERSWGRAALGAGLLVVIAGAYWRSRSTEPELPVSLVAQTSPSGAQATTPDEPSEKSAAPRAPVVAPIRDLPERSPDAGAPHRGHDEVAPAGPAGAAASPAVPPLSATNDRGDPQTRAERPRVQPLKPRTETAPAKPPDKPRSTGQKPGDFNPYDVF